MTYTIKIVALVMPLLLACGSPSPPNVGSSADVLSRLQPQPATSSLADVFGRREIPPGFSASYEPSDALGTVYAVVAKPGKRCDSGAAADFEGQRLGSFRKKDTQGCKIRSSTANGRYHRLVQGSANGGLELLVGGVHLDHEALYELTASDRTSAVFEAPETCVDVEALATQPLPDGTCYARYIVGAVVTEVAWRSYRKVSVEGGAAYLSLIRVGTAAHANTEEVAWVSVLSVDWSNPGVWIRDPVTGYLQVRKPQSAAKAAAVDFVKMVISGQKPFASDEDALGARLKAFAHDYDPRAPKAIVSCQRSDDPAAPWECAKKRLDDRK